MRARIADAHAHVKKSSYALRTLRFWCQRCGTKLAHRPRNPPQTLHCTMDPMESRSLSTHKLDDFRTLGQHLICSMRVTMLYFQSSPMTISPHELLGFMPYESSFSPRRSQHHMFGTRAWLGDCRPCAIENGRTSMSKPEIHSVL